MRELKINGVDYKIKYTIRALFIFEQITGKAFKIENLLDNYIFYYSILMANNPDNVIDWNEFINALDEDPTIIAEFGKLMTNEEKKEKVFEVEDGEGKKKD